MMIIGLTGGIGSGKTTVANMFIKLGVPVYNSDKEAKRLMKSSKKLKKAIVELLGKSAYNGEKLNKAYISKKIFNDKILLEALNRIVHPTVRKHFLKWTKKQKVLYVIQETAIIFENDAQDNYDKIILVTAPESVRIQRVAERDGIGKKIVLARVANQMKYKKKQRLSHYIIENTIIKKTEARVREVHNRLVDESR